MFSIVVLNLKALLRLFFYTKCVLTFKCIELFEHDNSYLIVFAVRTVF